MNENNFGGENNNETEEPKSTVVYRWDYDKQCEHDRAGAKKRSGASVYAFSITIVLVICLIAMIATLLIQNGAFTPDIEKTVYIREYNSESGVLTIQEISDKVGPSVVGIKVVMTGDTGSGIGTGIIMTEDGYIITNQHVVDNSQKITVVLKDNTEYSAKIVGVDEMADLALIKVEATGLKAAEFGNSDECVVGDLAVAIGTPAMIDYAGTTTVGYISGINRDVKIYDTTGVMSKKMTLLQTDASINPGNSGGPLINEYGKVIGITNMKLSQGYVGIGFAIPINAALKIINDIKVTGSSSNSSAVANKRPLIGVTCGGVTADSMYEMPDGSIVKIDIDGVIVVSLTDGLDAVKKLKVGDIITEVDGKSVYSVYDVMDIINNKNGGDTVNVRYYRDGIYSDVTITLGTEQ